MALAVRRLKTRRRDRLPRYCGLLDEAVIGSVKNGKIATFGLARAADPLGAPPALGKRTAPAQNTEATLPHTSARGGGRGAPARGGCTGVPLGSFAAISCRISARTFSMRASIFAIVFSVVAVRVTSHPAVRVVTSAWQ